MPIFKDFEVVCGEAMHGDLLRIQHRYIHDDQVGTSVDSGCWHRFGRLCHGKGWKAKKKNEAREKIHAAHRYTPVGDRRIT
jgi:hypothetical protein